ncbi:alpha/beta fold hydrolase [Natrarchaeobius oligotrophus]|uniref:Alpha/beta hydrolase n=1 Tax=Natrarchaeobius chitinivorans TaxID=1679083 RepID=A0A3N6M506_NATCH|nr:alpha/beta hydrolase [Natrarchaeobius chitinivorans]RQG98643.1 alpha/beta hydrolase [Natrarchaeobius chitinivorans]
MPLVHCNGAEIYYEDHGTGEPILFLHGAWAGCRYFEAQLTGLSTEYRTIAFDFRGHGRSTKTEVGHTLTQYAQDVHAILDHLALDDVVIVGWSLGAIVSWEYIDRFGTERVRALVDVDMEPSPMQHDDNEYGSYNVDGLTELHRRIQSEPADVIERTIDLLLKDAPSQGVQTMMFDEMSRTPPSIKSAMLLELLCDYRDVLPAIDVPTLVCAGADEKWRSVSAVEHAAELIPDARVELFEESGHCLTVEEPERFNDVVSDFVESL